MLYFYRKNGKINVIQTINKFAFPKFLDYNKL